MRTPELKTCHWGVVLAGGPGKRMGGHKPWRKLGEKTLVEHALANLAPYCQNLAVATAEVEPMAGLDCTVIKDRWPSQGPMNAVITALQDLKADNVLVLAVDYPLVRPELLEALAAGDPDAWALAPQGPTFIEPLMAWYRKEILPTALRLLSRNILSLWRVAQQVPLKVLDEARIAELDPDGHSFLNVNRPEDLERANRLAAERGILHTP